jgi:hypothetical protein
MVAIIPDILKLVLEYLYSTIFRVLSVDGVDGSNLTLTKRLYLYFIAVLCLFDVYGDEGRDFILAPRGVCAMKIVSIGFGCGLVLRMFRHFIIINLF